MKWTREKPTEPGWYWCDWGDDDYPWPRVEMKLVVRKKNGCFIGRWHVNHTSYVRFAGPIPEPEEPTP